MMVALIGLVSTSGFAQNVTKFKILVKYNVMDGDFKNSKLKITKDGAPFRVINPNKVKNNVELPFGAKYLFSFIKVGYITKSVIINTHIPQNREKEPFAKFMMEVRIKPQPEEQIITYSQPVGIIKYSEEITDFDFDKDYSLTVQEMQRKAIASAKAKPKPRTPGGKREAPPTAKKVYAPSKPIPVEVKKKEYKAAPPVKKAPVKKVVIPQKPLLKNKSVKVLQEDRRKITIVTINVDDVNTFYKKEEYAWGGVYYYKSNNRITELTFNKETE